MYPTRIISLFIIISLLVLPNLSFCEEPFLITIDNAYYMALKSHEHIQIAEEEIKKDSLLPKKAIAAALTHVTGKGSYDRPKEAIVFQDGLDLTVIPEDKWSGRITVEQPIYDFSIIPAYRMGKKTEARSREDYSKTVKDVLFRVAMAYYNVLKAHRIVDISAETLELTKDQLRISLARYDVGEVTKVDVLRAEVNVARAERNLIKVENDLLLKKHIFSNLIGLDIKQEYKLMDPSKQTLFDVELDELLHIAFHNRNDLKEKHLNIEIAKQKRSLAWSKFHPLLNVKWQVGWVDPETFAELNNFWDLTLNLEFPIFEGGRRYLDLKGTKYEILQAQYAYDRFKKDIETQVSNVYLWAQTLRSILETLRKEVELAGENYEITRAQYLVGSSTSTDVTDALISLHSAETDLANTKFDYQLSLIAIDKTIGVFADKYTPNQL